MKTHSLQKLVSFLGVLVAVGVERKAVKQPQVLLYCGHLRKRQTYQSNRSVTDLRSAQQLPAASGLNGCTFPGRSNRMACRGFRSAGFILVIWYPVRGMSPSFSPLPENTETTTFPPRRYRKHSANCGRVRPTFTVADLQLLLLLRRLEVQPLHALLRPLSLDDFTHSCGKTKRAVSVPRGSRPPQVSDPLVLYRTFWRRFCPDSACRPAPPPAGPPLLRPTPQSCPSLPPPRRSWPPGCPSILTGGRQRHRQHAAVNLSDVTLKTGLRSATLINPSAAESSSRSFVCCIKCTPTAHLAPDDSFRLKIWR